MIERLTRKAQDSAYASPWSWRVRMATLLWDVGWLLLFRPTPKVLSGWRVLLLRLFGARMRGRPFVASSVRIKYPWNLTMEHRACLGDRVHVYNLGSVRIGARATVAQDCYLCGGTHDLTDEALPLMVGEIRIGADAFIGAGSFINPGVRICDGAALGARSVVTRDLPPWQVCVGHPCKPIKPRPRPRRTS